MSRSFKKTPSAGRAGDSEKQDKRKANRVLRRSVRAAMNSSDEVLPELRELSNLYNFAKDGKFYFDPNMNPKLMRK